jgi:putative ABC transport system ATP-binding protein
MSAKMSESIVQLNGVSKTYQLGETQVNALRDVSLSIHAGEYVAIVGASGSGKSTLMHILGLLDRSTCGVYHLRSTDVSTLDQDQLAALRNREIGFVFQRSNLLARMQAKQQVELPMFYAGVPAHRAGPLALAALRQVGLADRVHHRPQQLSGGQQQRVAIARALVNRPSLLLADEPTGALDTQSGQEVMALFGRLHDQGLTLVVVTHDMNVADHAGRIITLKDGQVVADQWQHVAHVHAGVDSKKG